jgi:hypothetical protein
MALPSLRDAMARATAGVTAAALAATLIASPAAVNDAQAQTAPAATATQQVKVPTQDARGANPEAVRTAAAVASKNAQVVVFFGDNETAFQSLREGVRSAISQGLPVKGIIVGSPIILEKTVSGKPHNLNQVVFYADGTRTGHIDNPNGTEKSQVEAHLRRDFEGVILPRRADVGAQATLTASR